MQLKRQSLEAWQNEKHYSKENQIPEITQPQDKKFRNIRPCEVRRSGRLTTFVVCAVFSLSFQAVVLLACFPAHAFQSVGWKTGYRITCEDFYKSSGFSNQV